MVTGPFPLKVNRISLKSLIPAYSGDKIATMPPEGASFRLS